MKKSDTNYELNSQVGARGLSSSAMQKLQNAQDNNLQDKHVQKSSLHKYRHNRQVQSIHKLVKPSHAKLNHPDFSASPKKRIRYQQRNDYHNIIAQDAKQMNPGHLLLNISAASSKKGDAPAPELTQRVMNSANGEPSENNGEFFHQAQNERKQESNRSYFQSLSEVNIGVPNLSSQYNQQRGVNLKSSHSGVTQTNFTARPFQYEESSHLSS